MQQIIGSSSSSTIYMKEPTQKQEQDNVQEKEESQEKVQETEAPKEKEKVQEQQIKMQQKQSINIGERPTKASLFMEDINQYHKAFSALLAKPEIKQQQIQKRVVPPPQLPFTYESTYDKDRYIDTDGTEVYKTSKPIEGFAAQFISPKAQNLHIQSFNNFSSAYSPF